MIAEIGRPDGAGLQKIDGAGRLLVPGLIDTHFHGALGNCFGRTGPEGIREVAAFEAKQGVTAIVPAVSATTDENVLDTLRSIRTVMASGSGGARVEGVHLEGPVPVDGIPRRAVAQVPPAAHRAKSCAYSGTRPAAAYAS